MHQQNNQKKITVKKPNDLLIEEKKFVEFYKKCILIKKNIL